MINFKLKTILKKVFKIPKHVDCNKQSQRHRCWLFVLLFTPFCDFVKWFRNYCSNKSNCFVAKIIVKFFLCFSRCIQYFNKIILLLNMIGDETFNIMITNNVVSFEELNPGVPIITALQYMETEQIYRPVIWVYIYPTRDQSPAVC